MSWARNVCGRCSSRYVARSTTGLRGSLAPDIPSTSIPYSGALMQLESAVTLANPVDPDDEAWMPMETALTLEQGIEALTIHPAWQARMEDKIGSIEVGKYADLVFLESNLFDVGSREISEVEDPRHDAGRALYLRRGFLDFLKIRIRLISVPRVGSRASSRRTHSPYRRAIGRPPIRPL